MSTGAARAAMGSVGLALTLLAGCGGGSTQYQAFSPARILNFGDEMSALTPDGYRWGINYVGTTGTFDCRAYPLWIQDLATRYGMVHAQCVPPVVASGVTYNTAARTLAVPGATAAATAAQLASFASGERFTSTDLVTVLAGMNDIWAAYARFDGKNEATLIAEVEAAGEQLANQVNAVTDAGARVLVSTIPDQSLTPKARQEDALNPGTDRRGVIYRLSDAYNAKLRLTLKNDGSKIGLLLADDMSRSMDRVPSYYGIVNTQFGVCSAALPACTNYTLIGGVTNPELYMWADATRPAVRLHRQLGSQAVSRTYTNPF